MRILRRSVFGLLAAASLAFAFAAPASAATVNAAVAANFTKVAEKLGADFKAKTGDDVVFSFGATGALYTQITQGAPFDVFLTADNKRTATADHGGLRRRRHGLHLCRRQGRPLLAHASTSPTARRCLRRTRSSTSPSPIPRPRPMAPPASAVLDKLGLTEAVTPKIVTGENITQTAAVRRHRQCRDSASSRSAR